jgi:hypothetical protein
MKILHRSIYALLILLLFLSCKRDRSDVTKPPRGDEQELITTVKVILTNTTNSGDVREVMFRDVDGPGGNVPVVGSLSLPKGEIYTGEIILLDETKTPVDRISNDVYDERNEHQFFYIVSGADLIINYQSVDVDDNGVPLGLRPVFNVGNTASSGTFTVILKHQPGVKPTSGNGDITKGDTDVEVTFDVSVF